MTGLLTTFGRRWTAWWFPEVPVERIAVLRMALGTFVALELALFSRFLPRYGDVDPMFADPVILLRPLAAHVPSSAGLEVLQVVAVLAAVCLAVGWRTRAAALVTTVLYTYEWMLFNSFHKVNHGKIPVIIGLAVLVIAPAGVAWSLDAVRARRHGPRAWPLSWSLSQQTSMVAGWAVRILTVAIVLAYSMSVIGKLRALGLSWVTAPILQTALMSRDSVLASWFQAQPQLLVVFQGVTLMMEMASPLLLVSRRARTPLLLAFAGFHLGSLYLLRTEFLGFIVCYLAFYRPERLPAQVAALVVGGRHRGTGVPPREVLRPQRGPGPRRTWTPPAGGGLAG